MLLKNGFLFFAVFLAVSVDRGVVCEEYPDSDYQNTENVVYADKIVLGDGRWVIRTEMTGAGAVLVFRDTQAVGDKRFAMWPNNYVDFPQIPVATNPRKSGK